MSKEPDVRPMPKARPGTHRYLSTRIEPSSPAFSHGGDSVDHLRLVLQLSGATGRYRVFDRESKTRGVDAEMIGHIVVDAAGAVEWTPLLHVHMS